ncbi:serine/threonine-protein phosphatase BSL2 homolog isoform X2 [Camellia sinensis]|uniref:serine/threonine-protein phosphatase BSL2 homolog isoform X2 n=1 Tax=Camellia sinensis TaxID=4442 RepID=UPI001035EF05|nr:serine/threonine-protein phosphatase BSL2 homolog isoform X2 [Camellia sinensis]
MSFLTSTRRYATSSARSDGLLLLCGRRDANSVPLASAYGLAKHRDGRWEWAIAPGVSPSPRYQHAAVFVNARLHVSGGALGGGLMVEDSSSVAEKSLYTGFVAELLEFSLMDVSLNFLAEI